MLRKSFENFCISEKIAFKPMSYLTDSYIGFTLKMESVTKKYRFWPKNDGEKWYRKINFSRPLFTIFFRPKMLFLVTDSILRVKPMYESVK